MAAHHITVLLLHMGVIVGFVGAGPGEEQTTIPSPRDQGMVDALAPVIGIQPHQRERQPGLDGGHRLDHPPVGTILQRHVLRPPGEDICHGQRVHEFALQGRPAVQHRVCFDEAGSFLVFVAGLTHLNRVAQQRPRPGPGQADKLGTVPGRFQHPIDRRPGYLQQLRPRMVREALLIKLTVLLQLRQPDPHRRSQILTARLTSKVPHLDQQLHRVIPIRRRPRRAFDRPGWSLPGFRGGQRPPRVRPRPPGRGDQLIQHHTLGPLARTPILGSVLLRDLPARTHR
ncbi:hypothetical protein ADILRU_1137 [Leifsonia rubra CMS 76R]|nr:hypothetical protein ADILRU_1137 [Leifsonia rubra CMS 76R]